VAHSGEAGIGVAMRSQELILASGFDPEPHDVEGGHGLIFLPAWGSNVPPHVVKAPTSAARTNAGDVELVAGDQNGVPAEGRQRKCTLTPVLLR
jgi:hypothetical protein